MKEHTLHLWSQKFFTLCAQEGVPLAASHGDFWTRNVLMQENDIASDTGNLAGVVDWEHFSRSAPVFRDLFQFPLTYGFNYAWSSYRKRSPEDAFRLAFLDETHISRGVRKYFKTYCDQTELPYETLEVIFRYFLLDQLHQNSITYEQKKGNDSDTILWLTLYRMLDSTDRSVFSG
jgi:hypothetical protein